MQSKEWKQVLHHSRQFVNLLKAFESSRIEDQVPDIFFWYLHHIANRLQCQSHFWMTKRTPGNIVLIASLSAMHRLCRLQCQDHASQGRAKARRRTVLTQIQLWWLSLNNRCSDYLERLESQGIGALEGILEDDRRQATVRQSISKPHWRRTLRCCTINTY